MQWTALFLLALAACPGSPSTPELEDSSEPDTDPGPSWSQPVDWLDWDEDGYRTEEDCDDGDPDVHPGAEERCNHADDDCDGEVDEGLPTDWYRPDLDGDGYGDATAGTVWDCAQPEHTAQDKTDCDDSRADVHPGAPETPCDGLDNDCDGEGLGYQAVLDGVEYPTVDEAALVMASGETLVVCPGTHEAHLTLTEYGASYTLESWSENPEDTVLHGDDRHPVVNSSGPAAVTVQNLAFTRGWADPWEGERRGGAIAMAGGLLTVEGCIFEENEAASAGGAISAHTGAALSIQDSSFQDNAASHDGGAVEYSSTDWTETGDIWVLAERTLEIRDSTFASNEASYLGSAVYVSGWDEYAVSVEDSVFEDNHAGDTGTLQTDGRADHTLEVSGSEFTWNTATNPAGGGIQVGIACDTCVATVSISDTLFDSNYNSGLDLEGQVDVAVHSSTFTANAGGSGGGVHSEAVGSMSFTDVLFDANVASSRGGALYHSNFEGDMELSFVRTTFDANVATNGGGAVAIWVLSGPASASFEDCTVSGNTAVGTGAYGGALWVGSEEFTATSSGTDWGDGVLTVDNAPDDVYLDFLELSTSYDGEADFTCAPGEACVSDE